jgi:hypothetical protein
MAEKLRTTPTARDVAAAVIGCSKAHAAVQAVRTKVALMLHREDEDRGDDRLTP